MNSFFGRLLNINIYSDDRHNHTPNNEEIGVKKMYFTDKRNVQIKLSQLHNKLLLKFRVLLKQYLPSYQQLMQ